MLDEYWHHRLTIYRAQINDLEDTTLMEEYWNKHKLEPNESSIQPPVEANDQQSDGYRKARSMSAATTFMPAQHRLMPHHPAATLLDALRTFGPLMFPVYRAALLRRRILIVTDTPVEFSCNLGKHKAIVPLPEAHILQYIISRSCRRFQNPYYRNYLRPEGPNHG